MEWRNGCCTRLMGVSSTLILHELLMVSRYAKGSDRRRVADSLMEKLWSQTDRECMLVYDFLLHM